MLGVKPLLGLLSDEPAEPAGPPLSIVVDWLKNFLRPSEDGSPLLRSVLDELGAAISQSSTSLVSAFGTFLTCVLCDA